MLTTLLICCLIVNSESNTTLKSLITSTESATTKPIEKDRLSLVRRISNALSPKISAPRIWIRLQSKAIIISETLLLILNCDAHIANARADYVALYEKCCQKTCTSLPEHCRSVVAVQSAVWYCVELQIVQAMTEIVPSFDQILDQSRHW